MLALLVLPYQYREAKLGSSLLSGRDSCLPRPSMTPRPPAAQQGSVSGSGQVLLEPASSWQP